MRSHTVVFELARAATVAGAVVISGFTTSAAASLGSPSSIELRPADEPIEIHLPDGSIWRSARDAPIEVVFEENGVLQRLVGRFKSVERRYVVLTTTVAGASADKVIFLADMRGISAASRVLGDANQRRLDTGEANANIDPETSLPTRGVFVLPLFGEVGLTFRWQEVEEIGRHADRWGDGQIIVLHINSPGGSVPEAERISEALIDLKRRHRVIAWVEEAISGGAFVALHCEEIYFMSTGTLGAITQWNPATERAVPPEIQTAWAERCAALATRHGNHHAVPVMAMVQSQRVASYDRDPVTGRITWYASPSGAHMLSPAGENLVLNASNAVHCGLARGIANSTDDLAARLDLERWHELSDHGRRIADRWRQTMANADTQITRLLVEFGTSAPADPDRVSGLRRQLAAVRALIGWWNRAPNACANRGVRPKEQLERIERELQHQLAQATSQSGGGRGR